MLQLSVLLLLTILAISPPSNVTVKDKPDDAGSTILINWQLSDQDALIEQYMVMRQKETDSLFKKLGFTKSGVGNFEDDKVEDGIKYRYMIGAKSDSDTVWSAMTDLVSSSPQWFHFGRLNILICILLFGSLLIAFVNHARMGKKIFIRKIPGLEAVEDAVGRATEMGRPILYVPGLGDIVWTSTIASMNILGEVAKKIAKYDTPLIVANRWSVTYAVSKEVVKSAFITESKGDKFKEDYVRYLTEDQFGFAAAVNGLMLREKPATNFFIGRFWAESLIIAETGVQSGAIQIAGTDSVLQLPFFVAACDYTLIGEELYAASAYLSHNPLLIGALKIQDYGKIASIIIALTVSLLAFIGLNLLPLIRVQ